MELCFLCSYGEDSVEWAAWMQLALSVVTIIYTLVVARRGEWQRKDNVQKLLGIYLASIEKEITSMMQDNKIGNAPAIVRAAGRLSRAVDRSRYIDHSELPPETVIALTGIEDHIHLLNDQAGILVHGYNPETFLEKVVRHNDAITEAVKIIKEARHPRK
jgi:hypothetical protein